MRREMEAVYRLGLDLLGRAPSPDSTALSGCSGSSAGSRASSAAGEQQQLDLALLSALFPGLQNRDRETTKLSVRDDNITYSVWVSFFEIYNENVSDLLRKVPNKAEKRQFLKLRDDKVIIFRI